jgi:hypothetical protein
MLYNDIDYVKVDWCDENDFESNNLYGHTTCVQALITSGANKNINNNVSIVCVIMLS